MLASEKDEAAKIVASALMPFPTVATFVAWLRSLHVCHSPLLFVPNDECACPVARFLSLQTGVDVEIGDDGVSVDGRYVIDMPDLWRSIVRRIDLRFSEPFTATDIMQALEKGDKDGGL